MKKTNIFVDCFNTIILRKASPDDVLFFWGQEMNGAFPEVSAIDFYEMFKNGELEIARFRKILTGEREYTLQDIFTEVLKKITFYNLIPAENLVGFMEKAINAYEKVETENQYANKSVVDKLLKYKNQGAKIYVVSDFYCPKNILKGWLLRLVPENLIDDIFISCELGKSKRTGKLYDEVVKILNIDKKSVLMIGDNMWSDNLSAKKRGIKTKWIFKPYKSKSRTLKSFKHKLHIPVEYKELFKEYGRRYNYSNYAFPLYIFTKRLAENLQRTGAKNVFFLAREGHFMKQLFDHYKSFHNLDIKTHYLEMARGSMMSASLRPIKDENFDFILKARMIKPKSFLRSFSFTDEQVQEILDATKIMPSVLYKNFSKSKAYRTLINSPVFQKHYNDLRESQKNAFQTYLDSFGVDYRTEGLHIVDVGWNGTMQNMFKRFFENNNEKVDITGYYVGYFKTKQDATSKKIGLLFSQVVAPLWAESRAYRYRMRDYEQFLRAPKNRTVSYTETAPYVVYDEKINDVKLHKEVIAPLQNQIFEKFKKICVLDKEIYSNIDSVAVQFYGKIIKKISLKDYQFMNACQNAFYDSFGYVGHTLKFDVKIFKWLYFRFRDMFFLATKAQTVKRKKIFWH